MNRSKVRGHGKRSESKLTPVVFPKNSCIVNGDGIINGLSASSGIPGGIGNANKIVFLACAISAGSRGFESACIVHEYEQAERTVRSLSILSGTGGYL